MSLDLTKTALQLDEMALDLKARQGERELRLEKALEVIDSLDAGDSERDRQRSRSTIAWTVPSVLDKPGSRHATTALPEDFCVVATDGSHIDVDRHMPARCYLINIGVSALTYGSRPDARLSNRPRLYARDDELTMRDGSVAFREQAVQGAILGAKRTVEEIRALTEAVRELPAHTPTLALMDGSLVMLDLARHGYQDFVLRQLIEEGFVDALDELRLMARERPLALASYISLPRAAEVMGAIRLGACTYDTADCGRYCGLTAVGQRPCDGSAQGLLDRDVFGDMLDPGERSGLFGSSSPLVASYYGDEQRVCFFYVHAGEEIGRVEVPSWVAENETLLDLAHSLIVDQCRRGPGYPVALMEAHEQAVVTGADRQSFAQLVESVLYDQRVPVYSSEKNRSKRIRWV